MTDADDISGRARLSDIACKKFLNRDQSSMSDACVVAQPNVHFDRLLHMSFNASINETHLRR